MLQTLLNLPELLLLFTPKAHFNTEARDGSVASFVTLFWKRRNRTRVLWDHMVAFPKNKAYTFVKPCFHLNLIVPRAGLEPARGCP
jgi:hypothetical protein